MLRNLILGVLLLAIMLPSSLAFGQDDCDVATLAEGYSETLSEAETLADLMAFQAQMEEDLAACDEAELSESDDAAAVDTESLILNAAIKRTGAEVFPLPDRSSGREFAAAGSFAPHIAGRNEEGNFVYIYYFDGGLQDGWVPASQFAEVTEEQIEVLAVIDASNPPDLPDLPFDELAARPFGAASNTSNSDDSSPDADAASDDQEAVASPGSPPIIIDIFTGGTCDNGTYSVVWSDPDGDAAEVVLGGGRLGRVAIDGFSGTASFTGTTCSANVCTFDAEVFDRAGNRSGPRSGNRFCSN